jgi:hypothetical protein
MTMSKSMKREGPDPVAPVTIGGVRYEVPHFAGEVEGTQNGGYITAKDVSSGQRLWTLKVYETLYDPRREQDVQDVFITELTDLGDGSMRVDDEEGRSYIVDLATRTVREE